MTTEELRRKLTGRIDALLARTMLVRGEDRALLKALGGYVAVMAEGELRKVLGFFTHEKEKAMARKKMSKADAQAQAQALGIDLSKFDFARWLQIIMTILAALQQMPATQAAKESGCPGADQDAFCSCHEAAALALDSARVSLECCGSLCDGGGEGE